MFGIENNVCTQGKSGDFFYWKDVPGNLKTPLSYNRKLPLLRPPLPVLPLLAFLVLNSFCYHDVLKLNYLKMKNLFRSTCAARALFETVFLLRSQAPSDLSTMLGGNSDIK